ncbi:MAG: hypothetical protein IPL52_14795 [Flavobacteriales bacterium]|nr:hypothetical protein [Flavobacteriales bacterium]
MTTHQFVAHSILALLLPVSMQAQTNVGSGSFGFSDGVHPTFSVVLEGTDAKTVEGFWRDELKRISKDVSSKKEIIASGALLPQVAPDTVRVLVKAEQRKGSPMLTAHVAIYTRNGWVGPDSDPKVYDAGERYVSERTTALRRQLAHEALDAGNKQLARLQNELSGLSREQERMEGQIKKSNDRAADAAEDQEHARKEIADMEPRIVEQRAINASSPSAENDKALAELMKQQARLNERLRKAQDEERNMKKRAEDLGWEVKKNVEDQGRKTSEVAAQEAVVKELRAKLEAIH